MRWGKAKHGMERMGVEGGEGVVVRVVRVKPGYVLYLPVTMSSVTEHTHALLRPYGCIPSQMYSLISPFPLTAAFLLLSLSVGGNVRPRHLAQLNQRHGRTE
jgi:hypothetical protein